MFKKVFSLLFICLVYAPLAISSSDTEQITTIATAFLKQHRAEEYITAVALTVNSPKLIQPITIAQGKTDTHHQVNIHHDDLFQVGSLAKSFVVTLLLKLESDKKNHFDIDQPITDYFPQYTEWHNITITQLMNMTSGIPDYLSDQYVLQYYANHPYRLKANWANIMYAKPLLFKPGTQFNYSNTNYYILGKLVEKISGHSLANEIDDKILEPLKLNHTYFVVNQPSNEIKPHLVHGYQNNREFRAYFSRGQDMTMCSLNYLGAAGAMISNSEDISKWINALFTPGKVLNHREFNEMTTLISQKNAAPIQRLTIQEPYAFGLGINVAYSDKFKSPIYVYEGVTLGYRALYLYIPKNKTSIVITVNSNYLASGNHLIDLANKIAHVVV